MISGLLHNAEKVADGDLTKGHLCEEYAKKTSTCAELLDMKSVL